jgi:pimeloyl-ACP methyl ester carboxylesterase
MTERLAVFPSRDSELGLQSWVREMAAMAQKRVHRARRSPLTLPRGEGSVLLIPGFLAGDWSMIPLSDFLIGLGYRVRTARVLFNPGPTAAIVAQLDRALVDLARAGKVGIVGQSLGGVLAREMARRHSGAVRCVVTLCSPVRFPVTTPLEPFARLLLPFQDPGWLARRHDIAKTLPVPATAIYSMEDGIVDWRQCLQDEGPDSVNIRVRGSHTTMGSNPEAQAAIAFALARRPN